MFGDLHPNWFESYVLYGFVFSCITVPLGLVAFYVAMSHRWRLAGWVRALIIVLGILLVSPIALFVFWGFWS